MENQNKSKKVSEKAKASEKKAYTLKKGDTLLDIAKETGVSFETLRKLNAEKLNSLKIGDKILLA